MAFGRFIVARAGLLVLTLWLVSAIVFAGGQVLPGDVGRTLLGPLADAQAVAAINHQYGTDRPVLVQYWDWLSHAVTGDFGTSLALRAPVAPFVAAALKSSAALASEPFVSFFPRSHRNDSPSSSMLSILPTPYG